MRMVKVLSISWLCAAAVLIGASRPQAEVGSQPQDAPAQLAQAVLPAPIVMPELMQQKISLDLRNIDIVDALKFLSTKAGINIITTRMVAGRVTLMVENAVVKDVFDMLLRSNSLAYDKQNDIYNVMTEAEYRALYGENFADLRKVKVFYLTYSIPEQAFSLLDMLKSDIGKVLVDPETGNAMVMDAPERLKIMEQVLQDFQEKNLVKVLRLNYAKAKDVEEALKNQIDAKKVGLIKADERSNQVIVQALPGRMEQIEHLISELDQKTKEVIIDVNIVQVKLSDTRERGVEWEGLFDLGNALGMTYLGSYPFSSIQSSEDDWLSRKATLEKVGYVGSYPFSGTSSSYSAGRRSIGTSEMHLGVVGTHDFDLIIRYLETVGKTKILSNPKVAVVNDQEAKIHVGQKDAYVTTTTTTGTSTSTISENVTFVDVGVIISVVPKINNDGFITLKIKTEISSVVDTLITPTNNKIPIIDTSLAETTILVKDGSTVIIGGLRKDQNTDTVRRVPILSKIPFLGRLFSVSTNDNDRTELMIILTPRLISGEVFITSADGRPVGAESRVKETKDYTDLEKEKIRPGEPSAAFIPKEADFFKLKGTKTK